MSTSQVGNVNARIVGGEFGASYQLDDHWETEATLAYAWGENTTDDRALPHMPTLEARLGLSYRQQAWRAGALWRLVASQNRVAMSDGNLVEQDFGKTYQEHLNLAGDAGFGFPGDRALNEPGRTLWTKVDFSF